MGLIVVGSGARVAAAVLLCATLAACSAEPAWQVTRTLQLPHGIQALDWHPDGKHIAVTYSDPARLAQVWDVEHGTGLKTFPSLRWGTTQSGKEIGFSPDGKYLVVQDVLSNRPENHPFPRSIDDPLEIQVRTDKTAFQIARVWEWSSGAEVSKLLGPGSNMHSAQMSGFCWTGGPTPLFAVHRNAAVALYSFPQGELMDEVSILYPHPHHPEVDEPLWWRMVCDPQQQRVAVQASLIPIRNLKALGLPPEHGPTSIAVVDLARKQRTHTLMTDDALNGIVFTADGRYLVAYGRPPMQVWDAQQGFAPAPPIREPADKTGTMVALQGDWIAGMSYSLHIWQVGSQQKAVQDQPLERYSWRTAYHAASKTLAVARGNTLTLLKLAPEVVRFGSKP